MGPVCSRWVLPVCDAETCAGRTDQCCTLSPACLLPSSADWRSGRHGAALRAVKGSPLLLCRWLRPDRRLALGSVVWSMFAFLHFTCMPLALACHCPAARFASDHQRCDFGGIMMSDTSSSCRYGVTHAGGTQPRRQMCQPVIVRTQVLVAGTSLHCLRALPQCLGIAIRRTGVRLLEPDADPHAPPSDRL